MEVTRSLTFFAMMQRPELWSMFYGQHLANILWLFNKIGVKDANLFSVVSNTISRRGLFKKNSILRGFP